MRIIRGSNCEMRNNVTQSTRRNHAHASSMGITRTYGMACHLASIFSRTFCSTSTAKLPFFFSHTHTHNHNDNSSFECNNNFPRRLPRPHRIIAATFRIHILLLHSGPFFCAVRRRRCGAPVVDRIAFDVCVLCCLRQTLLFIGSDVRGLCRCSIT